MELYVKSFRELTADELYEILRLRAQVFVVEQNCPYQDLDGRDRSAYHVYLRIRRALRHI
jgi:ElaA protein